MEFIDIKILEKDGKTIMEVRTNDRKIIEMLKKLSPEEKKRIVDKIKSEIFKRVQMREMEKIMNSVFEKIDAMFRKIDDMFEKLENTVESIVLPLDREISTDIIEEAVNDVLVRELGRKSNYWSLNS